MRAQKWIIVLFLVGLVASTLSVAVTAQQPTASPAGTASITAPPRNSTVGPNETVSGKAQLPSGYSLWVMPYDGITGKYYPQGAVPINDEARWSVRLSFSSIPVGQVFQIRAVSANGNANSDLTSFVSSTQGKGGTTHLPTGAQAVEAISVTRGTSSSTGTPTPNASPSNIPIMTQNVSTTTSATSSVVQASTPASSSKSLLPGFESIYALTALAIAFILVLKGRLTK